MFKIHLLTLVLCLGSVDSTVILTANYEDGPCADELIIVTCSVVGASLRWTVTNTSLQLTTLDHVTFLAIPEDLGRRQVINTSTIDLIFYQNETYRNVTHLSSSTIKSEMHFHLNADGFVEIQCEDHKKCFVKKYVAILGTPPAPSDLKEVESFVNTEESAHFLQWHPTTSKQYLFVESDNGPHNECLSYPSGHLFKKNRLEEAFVSVIGENKCGLQNISNRIHLQAKNNSRTPEQSCVVEIVVSIIGTAVVIAVVFSIICITCGLCVWKRHRVQKFCPSCQLSEENKFSNTSLQTHETAGEPNERSDMETGRKRRQFPQTNRSRGDEFSRISDTGDIRNQDQHVRDFVELPEAGSVQVSRDGKSERDNEEVPVTEAKPALVHDTGKDVVLPPPLPLPAVAQHKTELALHNSAHTQ